MVHRAGEGIRCHDPPARMDADNRQGPPPSRRPRRPIPASAGWAFALSSHACIFMSGMRFASTMPISPLSAGESGSMPRRVLIVEDHVASRVVLARLFSQAGWRVTEVGTLAKGLAALDPPPDCIVLDLILPDGRG